MFSINTVISNLIAIFIFAMPVQATEIIERNDLKSLFEKHHVMGTFALYAAPQDQLILFNPDRANTRLIPASTFKIANSLIALETGIVKDDSEILPYGGKRQPIKRWERDMPLKQAFKVSNVPIYQGLARKIGFENYRAWLRKFEYAIRALARISRPSGSAVRSKLVLLNRFNFFQNSQIHNSPFLKTPNRLCKKLP